MHREAYSLLGTARLKHKYKHKNIKTCVLSMLMFFAVVVSSISRNEKLSANQRALLMLVPTVSALNN